MGAKNTSTGHKLTGDIQRLKATANGVKLAETITTTVRDQGVPTDELRAVREAVDARAAELTATKNQYAEDVIEWLNATRHFLCVQERTQATLLRRAA